MDIFQNLNYFSKQNQWEFSESLRNLKKNLQKTKEKEKKENFHSIKFFFITIIKSDVIFTVWFVKICLVSCLNDQIFELYIFQRVKCRFNEQNAQNRSIKLKINQNVCNIVSVFGSFGHFYKHVHFKWFISFSIAKINLILQILKF